MYTKKLTIWLFEIFTCQQITQQFVYVLSFLPKYLLKIFIYQYLEIK